MTNKSIYIAPCEPHCTFDKVAVGIIKLLRRNRERIAIFRPVVKEKSTSDLLMSFLLEYFHLSQPYELASGFSLDELEIALVENKFLTLIENLIALHQQLCSEYDFVVVLGLDHTAYPFSEFGLINHTFAKNFRIPYIPLLCGIDKSFDHLSRQIILERNALAKDHIEQIAFFIDRLDSTMFERFKNNLCDPSTPIFYLREISEWQPFIDEFMRVVDGAFLDKRIQATQSDTLTPTMFEYSLYQKAQRNLKKVVLPEGDDDRVLHAADIVLQHNAVELILLGDPETIRSRAHYLGLDLSKATIIDHQHTALVSLYAQKLHEHRSHKGVDIEKAYQLLSHRTYFGTMMVFSSDADAMVCGASHTTQETIRPALEIIKTAPGTSRVSSLFFMCLEDKVLVYADCAINENPTAQELAQIAIAAARNAQNFGIEARVAMLSYSTCDSGQGEDVEKVREATRLAQQYAPDLCIEGPIQYDAAIDPDVARLKLSNSKVAGKATIFIFPDLNTGNNTYKAVQRSSNALAIGPILQGLRKPVNDLSRGCGVNDIVNTILISAIQAQQEL